MARKRKRKQKLSKETSVALRRAAKLCEEFDKPAPRYCRDCGFALRDCDTAGCPACDCCQQVCNWVEAGFAAVLAEQLGNALVHSEYPFFREADAAEAEQVVGQQLLWLANSRSPMPAELLAAVARLLSEQLAKSASYANSYDCHSYIVEAIANDIDLA